MERFEEVLTNVTTVSKMGHFAYWAMAGGGLAAIGNGLLTTLSTNTSTAKWIGFQLVIGASRGLGIQMVCGPR